MADRIGQHFGEYRLVRLIGQGDYGEVYLGEHLRHSGQAAIKVLHIRLRDADALHFLNEEQHIYNLKHPHMVRLLDYDFKDDIPFLIMDYLPNGTLRQRYPEGTRLPLAAILSYVKQVADVLQYAHDKNLIHCGVKPENMFLGRNNAVLLSDFCPPLLVGSLYSQGKQAMSIRTVNYLAPEQIQGHPVPASDQYALGIVVYEWINGARPFDGSTSEIISKHLTMPPPPLRDKNPGLPNAIEQVVLRALAKDPKGRFPSVQDFANALEQAIPSLKVKLPSIRKINRRDAVRWGLPILVGAITTTTIIAVVIESLAYNPPPTPTPTTASPTPPLLGTTIVTYRLHTNAVKAVSWSPDGKLIASGSLDRTVQVWNATTGNHMYTYTGHSNGVKTVAWSPNRKLIASGGLDGTVQIWNATTGSHMYTYTGHAPQAVRSVTWSPNGKLIASGAEDNTTNTANTVQVWDATTGSNIFSYQHRGGVLAIAWSPDGNYIASGSWKSDHTVQIWNVASRSRIFTYHNHKRDVRALAWSPDSKRIASGSYDQTVQIWDAFTGNSVVTCPIQSQVEAVSWLPKGQRIVSGSDDNAVKIWDATNGQLVFPYTQHASIVWTVAWSPDGTRIASGSGGGSPSSDHTVRVWQAVDLER